jgi:uncharacterized protein (TIGR02646 family)
MRNVRKQGNGGFHLAQAHAKPPMTPEQATSRWHRFAHKQEITDALLNEQYRLCCYSELRADEEGLDYHIEHVENKSQKPMRTFDYTNLAASALQSYDLHTFKLRGEDAFGGHAVGKQQGVDMTRFVSCHQPDCRTFFAFLSDGRIVPAANQGKINNDRAQYTIDLLNLNCPFLQVRRKKWWDELTELFEEHIGKGWEILDLVAIDLIPTNNKLSRFFSLTRQFFGPKAELVLQQDAPHLL